METCSHVCSLRMAATDVANENHSLQTTSRMCIWKKARACLLFVPCGVERTIGSAFFFLLCARVGEKVSSLHVRSCVPFRAGVEDALEQQREFDEHVLESKRYAC